MQFISRFQAWGIYPIILDLAFIEITMPAVFIFFIEVALPAGSFQGLKARPVKPQTGLSP